MFDRMFPELHVSNCEAAAKFFEDALGYTRGFSYMENGHLDFAVMDHPNPALQLSLHQMMPASEADKTRYFRLYFEPQDIHTLCANLRAKGFTVSEPEPTDYGATVARLKGPDNFIIWFQQWNRPHVQAIPKARE